MEMKDMFAARRRDYLAKEHPDTYAAMEAAGELEAKIELNAQQAMQIMQQITCHYETIELNIMAEGKAKEIRKAQILTQAQEIALQEIVLKL